MRFGLFFPLSNRKTKPLTKFIVLSVCSIALLIADGRFSLLQNVRSIVATALYPLQTVANVPAVTYQKSKVFLTDQTALNEENQKLKLENAQLQAQIYNQKTLAKTLAELETLEKIKTTRVSVVATAEIVISNQSPFSNRLHIAKGSNDGVALGQAVVDSQGLLGQITGVSPYLAEITLLISNKQITPVMIERTGDRALLYGTGNGVELRYLSTEVDLKADDRLVTSGFDGIYTPGTPVARITEAQKIVASPFYKVKSVPLAGVRQSRYVFVLAKDPLPEHVSKALAEEQAQENAAATPRGRP